MICTFSAPTPLSMYAKRNYGFWMTFYWSKRPFILGGLYGLGIAVAAQQFNVSPSIPWGPLGVMGIAVAFYLGFKNNSSYDRTWEARKIWGSIVNNSRSFGSEVMAFVQGVKSKEEQQELIYRHLAWLICLRYQLRTSREWEHTERRIPEFVAAQSGPDYKQKLKTELVGLLNADELDALLNTSNMATQVLKNQAVRLQDLRNAESFEDFRHMALQERLVSFYEDQGKSERIKNFPFPRQYASTAVWLTLIFSLLLPFGLLDILPAAHWLHALLCGSLTALITWVFFLMEKIGDYSENPFEGTYNDVPITSISRAIEIDLREMLGEANVPSPIVPVNGFLM